MTHENATVSPNPRQTSGFYTASAGRRLRLSAHRQPSCRRRRRAALCGVPPFLTFPRGAGKIETTTKASNRRHPVMRDQLPRGRPILSGLSSWRTAQVEFAGPGFRGEASTAAARGPSDSRFQQPKRALARASRTSAARMREASRAPGRHLDAPRADSRALLQRLQ